MITINDGKLLDDLFDSSIRSVECNVIIDKSSQQFTTNEVSMTVSDDRPACNVFHLVHHKQQIYSLIC